jgi:hypothetical protein
VVQCLHGYAAADLVLELGRPQRRVLHVEHLPVARLADELPVLLEGWQRLDPLHHFLVARLDAQPLRFRE